MSLPPSAGWCLSVVFACSGGWFLYQCVRATAGTAERISLFLHAVMCLVMIPMVWPWGARIPHGPQVTLLGAGVVWFVVSAVRERRMTPAIRDAHHALMAAMMAWMVITPMPVPRDGPAPRMAGGHAAMAQMSGPTPAAVTLAAYCLVATVVWLAEAGTATGPQPLIRRLPSAAGHAAMSLGAGVLTLAMS
ncbi:DUF5134 domain-containing protein [Actinoallomurus iriomotensis]|uniref:DUF5134 domain-containing protein n=1 Tax=Actinoallomurus iriomotensis TaxID=478107 RepID=A0A9W6VQ93_9ACTN|nr:DUF5134 domain-containing protein [Actinoallomurus iriomotensis]GLY75232.1 hypothetical protein Airi01_034990 [Actinoallomurus iriomotensis]